MFPEAKTRGTLRVERKQNSLFLLGPVIKCFVIPPDSKLEITNCEKMFCLTPAVVVPAVRAAVETELSYRNDTIIYDLSYIHLHSSSSTGILRTHNVTSAQWLDSSVGRALHRYRRGRGFESRSGLNFFQALISQLLKLCV